MGDPKKYILEIARQLAAKKAQVEIVGIKKAQGLIDKRIFNAGLDDSGNRIGTYSTKQRYFRKSAFVNGGAFKPVGKVVKNVSAKNKTGRRQNFVGKDKKRVRKSMFLDGGYKQLRSIQGFQTEYVDLDYSGSLRTSVEINLNNAHPELGIYAPQEVKIANGLEQRYSKTIFSPTSDEKNETIDAMREEIKVILQQAKR